MDRGRAWETRQRWQLVRSMAESLHAACSCKEWPAVFVPSFELRATGRTRSAVEAGRKAGIVSSYTHWELDLVHVTTRTGFSPSLIRSRRVAWLDWASPSQMAVSRAIYIASKGQIC